MSRLCSERVLQGLLRRHIGISHRRLTTTTTTTTHHFSNSIAANGNGIFSNSCIFSLLRSSSKSYSSSSTTTRLPYTIPKGLGGHAIGAVRFRSTKVPRPDGGFGKKLFDKPAAAVSSAFSRYSEAVGLQIEAFFRRNSLFIYGAAGVMVCALLWKMMYGIASAFIGFSEGMAKYGFLALSSAIVSFAGLYIRSRFTINPDKVYRMAMTRLNTSAQTLEVMGAPLSGSDIRAYVMSGGGITLKKFKPSMRSKRCFLFFPIRGSERKGLVSVEVKKKKGQYDMKLLAVDVPMASGPDQRLYLIGDEEEYRVGGGLIAELRDPVVKAMAATKEFDYLDEVEEREDAERERQEAERKQREEIEKLENSGTRY
ncbi:hypothetical protein PIB30_058887 [Stylosanthes scabra]|uniref:Import inner membrane translocase subunit n=2 Tax=Stylosanthes scabra TaxID=79078 RepID=A0ABU6XLM9_9FABA|nr:hypothetical protein [Stylosanthes scabra]